MSEQQLDQIELKLEHLENNVLERVGHQGNRLRELIDAQLTKLHEIDKTLARNTDSLELHIRRTEQLEERTEQIEVHVLEVNGAIKFMKGFVWFLGAVLTCLAVIKAIGVSI